MDDVLTFADELTPMGGDHGIPWKILIADDEPSVHLVTKLALGDFTFEGRRLELISAYGEADTRRLLTEHPDIALILLDVVMDTMDSGFALVRYIRETLQNKDLRIIMRTGQSGNAPEDRIIINYDINDFKDKTELTVAKLRTTLISSLRTYSYLKIIAEEQRKASANRTYLNTIINSLSSVLITIDGDMNVVLWNDEAHRWTGVTATVASGRNLFETAPVFEPLKGLVQELLSGQSSDRVERASVPLWNGEQVFVQLTLQSLAGSAGPEILVRLDDRTKAKRLDDQMIQAQKVSAFSALAAGVAGELGPLLQDLPTDKSRFHEWGQRATGLLERLARYSSLAVPGRDPQNWDAVVRRKIQSAPFPSGVVVDFRGTASPAWVGGTPKGLEALVDNLLENAIDATTASSEKGGGEPTSISVVLERQELADTDRAKHPDVTAGTYWSLTVKDHGVGMAPEAVSQVFDPYFTTKPESQGLGLGLPLVFSLVESLGGFVDVTSTLGAGTSVRVCLPMATPHGTSPVREGTVLICDDEPMMRQVAGKMVKHLGYQVLEAEDGAAALDLFRTQRSAVSLVILDVVLPGIPGLDVFREIHRLAPEVPVLLSSGFGRGDFIDQALDEGVAGFLQKPYRAETLAAAVSKALG